MEYIDYIKQCTCEQLKREELELARRRNVISNRYKELSQKKLDLIPSCEIDPVVNHRKRVIASSSETTKLASEQTALCNLLASKYDVKGYEILRLADRLINEPTE